MNEQEAAYLGRALVKIAAMAYQFWLRSQRRRFLAVLDARVDALVVDVQTLKSADPANSVRGGCALTPLETDTVNP